MRDRLRVRVESLGLACEDIFPIEAVEDRGDLSQRDDTDWRHGDALFSWKRRRKEEEIRVGLQGRSAFER